MIVRKCRVKVRLQVQVRVGEEEGGRKSEKLREREVDIIESSMGLLLSNLLKRYGGAGRMI
jgi:c-di-GMP-binding flagellar brake protein YcgR